MPAVATIALVDPGFDAKLRNGFVSGTEQVLASIVGACAAVAFFWLMFGQFRSLWIALASTMIFALGTSMWSSATRALFTHGPLVLMLVIVMILMQRSRLRPALIQYSSIPLGMALVMRPTAAVPIAVLSAYVLLRYRRWFVRYLAWSMLIAVPWIAFNIAAYGEIFPPYYFRNAFTTTTVFVEGLMGNLISPSRGLFVFSPVLLFAFSGFVFAMRDREQRMLHLAYGMIVIGHSIIIGSAAMWWAGASYGPRFMTDIVPFLVYFAAFNFRLPAGVRRSTQAAVTTGVLVLATVSTVMHAQGALRESTVHWNWDPQSIDDNPSRAWSWRDAQFARTLAKAARIRQRALRAKESP